MTAIANVNGKDMVYNEGWTEKANQTIIRTEKANSYEFGSAGNRFKLYFEEADDLLRKVKELRATGFQIEIAAGL